MAQAFTPDELRMIRQAMRCNLRRAHMITIVGILVAIVVGVACIVLGIVLSRAAYVGGGVALVILVPALMVARTVNVMLFGIIQKLVRELAEAGGNLESRISEQPPINEKR